MPRDFTNDLLFLKNGDIWAFPWRLGVWQLNLKQQSFSRVLYNGRDTLLPRANISKAIEDAQGEIWITQLEGGLVKYDPATQVVKNIIPDRRMGGEYLINGCIWIATSDSLFSVNTSTDEIDRYALPEGKNRYVYDFMPDKFNHIWIATKNGLLAFDLARKTFQQFTEDDGLYANNLEITFLNQNNGNIVMAGSTYITTFSPSIAQKANPALKLLFRNAVAGNNPKKHTDGRIDLDWNEPNITLQWALLNYSNPLGNQYYYKLEGVDKDWQYAGNKGQTAYNTLSPGSYTFFYKAATSEGMMSEVKTMMLVVHPPFWQTWWFRITALLVLGLLFFYIVKYIAQRNLKEKILALEKEQAVEKERNRISRDMHDDLGSGLTRIAILTEVIKTRDHTETTTINKISETARMLVDNLDEMVWALNPRNDTLDMLIAYIAEYAHKYLEDTGIDCIVSMPDEIADRPLSEEKRRNIFMAVKEFLNNSVKHSGASAVSIHITVENRICTLKLSDNGRGFDANSSSQLGNGISNMQQRIMDIGATCDIRSSTDGTHLSVYFTV